jgi:hypothetical protein
MQSNTTGHSMEIFLTMLLLTILCVQYFLYSEFRMISARLEIHERYSGELCNSILAKYYTMSDEVKSHFDRALLATKESDTTKPIKPNNWDSVREAFKGPVRVDERD